MQKTKNQIFPWSSLGYFGLVHGIVPWLEIISIIFGDSKFFYSLRIILLIISYIFLFDFGIKGCNKIKACNLKSWIIALPIIISFTGIFYGLKAFEILSSYTIGLISCVCAAILLYKFSKNNEQNQSKYLVSASCALFLYAFFTNFVVIPSNFFPASFINENTIFQFILNRLNLPLEIISFIRPILIIRTIISIWLLLAFAFYVINSKATETTEELYEAEIKDARRQYYILGTVTIIAILLLGWIGTETLLIYDQNWAQTNLMSRVKTSTAAIDPVKLTKLIGIPENVEKTEYKELKRQLDSILKSNNDCGSIYIAGIRRGKGVILVDSSIYSDDQVTFLPGEPVDALEEYITTLCDGNSYVVGPMPDKWGVWVTGIDVIRDPRTGRMIAALGMDIDANQWIKLFALHTLPVTAITFVLCLLSITIYLHLYKNKESAAIIKASERLYKTLVEGSPNSIKLLDTEGRILTINQTGLISMGLKEKNIIGEKFYNIWPKDSRSIASEAIKKAGGGKVSSFEAKYEREDGCLQTWHVILNPILDNDQTVKQYVAISSDITDRKVAEEQLLYNSLHDSLTGLPNRAYFMKKLSETCDCVRQDNNYKFAILFLDFDRFKIVNDNLGHLAGDKLLFQLGERLRKLMGENEILARFGGDEFILLLKNLQNPETAYQKAQQIMKEISYPFNIENNEVFSGVSIGIAIRESENDPENVLKDADTAMYRAKSLGKGRYEVFDQSQYTKIITSLQIESELHKALENNEFILSYQPIISIETGEITKLEAFIRWDHPQKGIIYPADFLEVSKESGIIILIGEWVLKKAFEMAYYLQLLNNKNIKIVVNMSDKEFYNQNLIKTLQKITHNACVSPELIEIEFKESSIIKDIEYSKKILKEINFIGLKICIGDFSSSLSLLSHLKTLPIDGIKIPKSFISNIQNDPVYITITKSIIKIAHNLNFKVGAVGVETEEQLSMLISEGCDDVQGYYFSTPVFDKLVESLFEKDFKQDVNKLRR